MLNNGRMAVEGLPVADEVGLGVRVKSVHPGETAQVVGIRAGDVIEYINGLPIRDPIDYRFNVGDEEVELVVRRGEEALVFELEKDADDDLGLVVDDMPILKCDNKCVFCFLHQMPKGMRKTLYYQDDDYRLSFLHGAYVTLTNMSEEEFDRVIEQRLSPMYISVHATDPDLRGRLLGRSDSVDVMGRIRHLARNRIQMHAQIVLCPGLNDGQHLTRTVYDLADCYPDVASLGIVPLGLTRFRKNLPELSPVTPELAAATIDEVTDWQEAFRRKLGVRFVYLGDEFHLMAQREIPAQSAYDGFPLVENGIGMVRRFIDAFHLGIDRLEELSVPPLSAKLVTGVLGEEFLKPLAARASKLSWLACRPIAVPNRFFGSGITVTGLLTGKDILNALEADPDPADVVVLPPNCINHEGTMLDDLAPSDLSERLGMPVVVGSYDLAETLAGLAEQADGPELGRSGNGLPHPYIAPHQLDT